ncbi:hypothetical protein ACMAY8_13465 [Rhodobacteraceae bacterium nBUS_22]
MSKKINFNLVLVAQAGRLQYEAVLFLASLRANSPEFLGKVFVAEPQPGPCWERNPKINSDDCRKALLDMGAEIYPFENRHFGQSYPYGNKIECLAALPEDAPFVFFDTDTLITCEITDVPFDFNKPSASSRCKGTWPEIELYGPGYTAIWKSLYDKFDLDFESSLDRSQPDEYWRRYLYFNAGYFYFKSPYQFGTRFTDFAVNIRDNGPETIQCQTLNPWLDQVALPLVLHSFKGKRDALPKDSLDGATSCHYRTLPLLCARESDAVVTTLEQVAAPNKIKKVFKQYEPFKRLIYHGRGHRVRALFDQDNLPRKERAIRNKIKSAGYWMR